MNLPVVLNNFLNHSFTEIAVLYNLGLALHCS